MTTAIKATVQEHLAPRPPKNNMFSQSRIRQKLLSRQLDPSLPTIPDASADELLKPEEEEDGEEGEDAEDSSSTTLPPDSPPLRSGNDDAFYSKTTLPSPEIITVEMLEKHMYTSQDPPLDLFVRTSGVERLSDFMLWQCHQDTQIYFLDCLWPDFDLQHFIWVLLEWQWRVKQNERDEALSVVQSSRARR